MFAVDLIGLDFETYGAVNLPDHGLERYVSDSSFRPLIACTAVYTSGGAIKTERYDLSNPGTYEANRNALIHQLKERRICAHNAGFEERVLRWMKINVSAKDFIDSAMVARAAGAGGKLEAAAPQLLGIDKMEDGWRLIKLFSIPSKEQLEEGKRNFNRNLIPQNWADWETFYDYCELDASLSLRLAWEMGYESGLISETEIKHQAVTMEMNTLGWNVDTDTVEEMQRRYLENQDAALAEFQAWAGDINLNSLPQQKEFCSDRGVKATSFDEKSVAKMAARIKKKTDTMAAHDPKIDGYLEVLEMLKTKQILGGSSLKKLQVILDTVGEDGRLRDQYLHIGAGQSWRTTGRSVQMQNLKRLKEPANMDQLFVDDSVYDWNNDMLAQNLRQVFTATEKDGALIVGDFASVESRGLAWLANAHWKLDSYRDGKDLYKVLAANIYNVPYADVTKVQRQTGKVGELSCGYQAGGEAVQSFAAGMGVEMTEAESAGLVADWRAVNTEVVALWAKLDMILLQGFASGHTGVVVGWDYTAVVKHWTTPASLLKQHPGAQSLALQLLDDKGNTVLTRIFHGCYERGRGLCYYKPSQLKGGDLWVNHFTDPKTKQIRFYNIYGGKLAGILTQSFCREIFFRTLLKVSEWVKSHGNLDLIGQFHDEIVVEWHPNQVAALSLEEAKFNMAKHMSWTDVRGFPLEADVKHDYRYTK